MELATADHSYPAVWYDVMRELKQTVQLFRDSQSSDYFGIVHAKHNCAKHKSIVMVKWYYVPDYERRKIRAMKCWICVFWC